MTDNVVPLKQPSRIEFNPQKPGHKVAQLLAQSLDIPFEEALADWRTALAMMMREERERGR